MKYLLLIFSILFCLSINAGEPDNTHTHNPNTDTKTTLVAYFSATGTTAEVAKRIAGIAHADLYVIEPQQAYTPTDLDWSNKNSRSSIEMKNKKSRPAIKGAIPNISKYKTIYLGFPIWWYQQPTIINTFIEKNDLKGKNIKTFATSGGSTQEKADKILKADYPDIHWISGELLNSPSDMEIKDFIK